MMKRLVSWILCLLLVGNLCLPARAAKEEEEAPAPVEQVTVVLINSPESFLSFAESCRLDSYSKNLQAKLVRDIDLTGLDFSGVPIFCGTFLGNGHTISGLNIQTEGSEVGLFRYLTQEAVVKDLHVSGVLAPGGSRSNVGGIAGQNAGTVENCSFQGTVIGSDQVGGIAGSNTVTGIIDNCRTEGRIHGDHFIGGIAGNNMGVVRHSTNEAAINITPQQNTVALEDITLESITSSESANTVTDVGGIAGTSGGVIRDCDNLADIGYRHMGYNIGGIAGSSMGYVTQSKNFGAVNGRKEVGGIVGQMEPVTQIVFTTDTLQILQGQLDTMGALAGRATANLDSAGTAITGQVHAMQENVQTAKEATQVLLPGGSDDLDSILAAQNALSSSFQGMQNNMQNISNTTQSAIAALSSDLRALTSQIGAMGATLRDAPENIGGTVVDISDEDTALDTTGKVENCANYGAVLADLNAGGVAGAISPENDLDPEDDLEISGETSLNFDSELRAVILNCENRGDVTATKSAAGGIAGRMALGLVKQCLNLGDLSCAGADYVGGIAGDSDGFLRENSSKSALSGESFVGGIAGFGKTVTDNRSMARLSGTERLGAVLGHTETRESVAGNYYMTLEQDPGAIDGISYDGCAQRLDVAEFLALEGLDTAFRYVTLTFVFVDGTQETVNLMPGEALKERQIPQLPAQAGNTARWEGLDSLDVTFDRVYTATYEPYATVLESRQQHKDGRPLVLCEGAFGPGETVELTEAAAPEVGQRQVVAECVGLVLPQSGSPITVRLHPNTEATISTVLLKDSSGTWQEAPFQQDGSYLVFAVAEDTCAVALVEEIPIPWRLIVIPFILAAVLVIVIVAIRKKKR